MLDSADSWIVNYAEKSPAFIAARAGYDVWLGNLRGNKHSNEHEFLDIKEDAQEFFDFSINEHYRIDLVSMIDYIRSVNLDNEKIAYIGHSMGTTIMFRLAAERPAYVEENISTFIATGPVLFPKKFEAPVVKWALPLQKQLYRLFELSGQYSIGMPSHFSNYALELVCGHL